MIYWIIGYQRRSRRPPAQQALRQRFVLRGELQRGSAQIGAEFACPVGQKAGARDFPEGLHIVIENRAAENFAGAFNRTEVANSTF
jgi:hypothetical protein